MSKTLATIAGKTFTTQKSLKEYADNIKRQYKPGEQVSETDKQFVLDLLKNSDQFHAKSPCDEPELALGKALGGTVCWYLIDESTGEKAGISTPHAIRCAFGARSSIVETMQEFKQASRETILSQVNKFKQDQATATNQFVSAISGDLLDSNEVHIDHAPPHLFDNLLFEFVQEHAINPLKVGIEEGNGGRRTFVKQSIKDTWSAYHQEKAQLRVVSIAEHKALTIKPNNDWASYINNINK